MIARWLAAVDAHPDTIETDSIMAAFIAQEPDRLWALTDVYRGLRDVRELVDLRDAFLELLADGFVTSVVELDCDCDTGPVVCQDALCGDVLFRIRDL
ncbi:hypothetical protein MMAD_21570 [Mycolicibacterium madagascariense]|uniref:Uncharacterized protein n=1 Tax=Mycolicibacterium madagascariense TaxID=212765 RepID=A0A7I7XFA5_9MYCO|nr:hypothetical protein [Mycolicibacterium madagascariense]MCV7015569.1 hypothetical protein [Mycolicibacterium madagascariense]BBZ27862.1 hypothetical protein MMAD_21570 [Mycolicibacterium madagascariense]